MKHLIDSVKKNYISENTMTLPAHIKKLIERGALFIVNHSGGKDSQAMFNFIWNNVPHDQIHVVHAHLPGVEWEGTADHVKKTIGSIPYHEVVAVKTFFDMVKHRGFWPSPKYRQCTSDLKRGPIEVKVREISKKTGNKLIVNCVGLRFFESAARSKIGETFKLSTKNSKAGREWYEWLPIYDWRVEQVVSYVAQNGQELHWAYKKGMTRLSCCFCIMAKSNDLKTAAKLNPELFETYVKMEKELDQTFIMPEKKKDGTLIRRFLEEIIGSDEEFGEGGECQG